ncbi:MAG: hypothetical protein SGJ20_12845 [Planctomycetota bacterium]|nr:hypothetical protein [Planctomycetota bacterium]
MPTAQMSFYDDPAEMRLEILKHVPLGAPLATAKSIMEANGFDCAIHQGEAKSPYLYCDQSRIWKEPVVRRWQVVVYYDESGVTDITVSTGLIGP